MHIRNIKKEIIEIVSKYCEELKKVINLESVYIFGSYSKGIYSDESDIDILVVSPDFKDDIIEDMRFLMKLRRKIDRRIEPHPLLTKDFNEKNPFIEQIKNDLIKVA